MNIVKGSFVCTCFALEYSQRLINASSQDYCLVPSVVFPGGSQDMQDALTWYGDPIRLFVMGHSAGAHVAIPHAIYVVTVARAVEFFLVFPTKY